MEAPAALPTLRWASPGARAWAVTVDCMIFVLAWLFIGLPLLYLIYGAGYFEGLAVEFDGGSNQTISLASGPLDLLISWLLPLVVLYAFWVLRGATPGKMATSIRIVDARTGLPASPLQLAVRLVGWLGSILTLGIGFIWIFFDRRRQGLHDKLARTLVIDTWLPADEPETEEDPPTMAAATPSRSTAAGPDPNTVASSWLASVHLALFQFGASLLLLAVLVGGIRRFVVRSEMLEMSGRTFFSLREAGLYPAWLEITFYHALTLATFLAAAVGLFLVWGAKQHREARLLALFLGFFFLCQCVIRMAGVDGAPARLLWSMARWLALAALLRFAVVFPRPMWEHELTRAQPPEQWGPARRSWWWARTLFRQNPPPPASSRGVRHLVFSPPVVWGGAVAAALLFHFIPDLPEIAGTIATLAILCLLIAAADLLWTNIKHASAADRNRGLWVAYGVWLSILIPILIGVGAMAVSTTAYLAGVEGAGDMAGYAGTLTALIAFRISPLVLTLALALAMFYKGEISPGFAIRKTTLYAALGVVGMLVFAAVEHLLSNQVSRILPLSGSASGLISALLGAGSIGLFRSKLRVHTDALFNRVLPDLDDAEPPPEVLEASGST